MLPPHKKKVKKTKTAASSTKLSSDHDWYQAWFQVKRSLILTQCTTRLFLVFHHIVGMLHEKAALLCHFCGIQNIPVNEACGQ